MPRVRVFLAIAALVVVVAGCQVDATVDLTMAEDGSGEVTVEVVLDGEAAERVPNLADDLRVRDLEATGWTVTGPTDAEGGGMTITASKPFATPEQGRAVLREVGGRGGILRAIELQREHSFGETTWTFGGRLDLSRGLASFSDDALDEVLGGEALGQDQAALEQQLGEPLADTVSVSVTAQLPDGEFTTDGESGDGATTATWRADLGDEPAAMAATSSQRDSKVMTYAAVSAGAIVALVLLLVARAIRGGVRRRRRRQGIPTA